jgi:uncharacterized protein YjiS (DUF1127 family)
MDYVIRTHARRSGWLTALGALLPAVVLLPMVWMQRIQRRRELMGLLGQPDHLLKDIGLQRSDIAHEGLKRFWIA